MKDWEEEAVRKKCPVAKEELLSEHGGLQVCDLDCDVAHMTSSDGLEWTRNNGWTVLAAPPDHKGEGDDEKLASHAINHNLVEMTSETKKSLENVDFQLIKRKDGNADA